jgi:hypothetical protein
MLKTFTPLPLQVNPSSCRAWFDFSNTSSIQASGNDIVSVLNLAGNGNNLSQAVSGNRPETGLLTQNGLNVAKFTAANTEFLNFAFNTPMSVPFTIFLVGRSDSSVSAIQNFIGRQTGTIAGQWVLRREASGGVFNTFGFGSGNQSSQAAFTSNNNANIHTTTLGDNIAITYRVNNTLSASASVARAGYDNAVTTGLALGTSNNFGNSPLEGWIGEVIIYNSILPASQITAINQYLSRKWGVAIS